MTDNRRTKMIILIVLGVIVALLAGGAAGWFARGAKIAELEERIDELEGALADEDSVVPTETAGAATGEGESEGSGSEEPAESDAPPSTGETGPTTTGPTERQPGLVVGVTTSGGTSVLQIDYVQFLTGGEAADAAAAHGDESPPPNDYYIVNDNPRIREFPIQPGIPVTVVTNNDGTSDPAGHTITLTQWITALGGPNASAFRASLYWVTVTNGTITAIEAQYVP